MSRELLRTATWRSKLWPGSETCSLYALADGWELSGFVNVGFEHTEALTARLGKVQDHLDFTVTYLLLANTAWEARRISIEVTCASPKLRNACTLVAGRNGAWKQKSGNRAPDLKFFTDALDFSLDVSAGLYTQQLPRLDLQVGADDELGAARLNIPGLAADLIVTYVSRPGEDTYITEEELPDQMYEDELSVADLGLIVECARWKRVEPQAPQHCPTRPQIAWSTGMAGQLIRIVPWMASEPASPDRCPRSAINSGWELKGEAPSFGLGPDAPQRVLSSVRTRPFTTPRSSRR